MATPHSVTVDDPAQGHDAAHANHGGDGHHGDLMLVGHDGQLHPANLQHHFVSAEQQFEASKLGMWLFLVTEILLFGGMFVAYAIYRAWYPELFEQASTQLDTIMGAVNTLVLLASSLTVAWAIRAAQMDNRKLLVRLLWSTVLLAGCFMVIKYFEYTHKFELGIFPGKYFVLEEGVPTVEQRLSGEAEQMIFSPDGGGADLDGEGGGSVQVVDDAGASATGEPVQTEAAAGEPGTSTVGAGGTLEDTEHAIAEAAGAAGHDSGHADDHGDGHGRHGEIFSNPRAGIFFSIYYVMTGIHGVHVLIGMVAISILAINAQRGKYTSVYYTPVENVGLYWHVVDVIWIFLFPLMYLI